jgi:hypothetical protein
VLREASAARRRRGLLRGTQLAMGADHRALTFGTFSQENEMRTSLLAATLPMLLVTAAGCDMEFEDHEEEAIERTLATEVARVTTDRGDVWSFFEEDPGEIFIWATLREADEEPFRQFDADRLSYVEIYRQLTDQPVPRSLRAAQRRADDLISEEHPDDDRGEANEEGGEALREADGSIGRTSQAISAASYQSNYCGSASWPYSYCWPQFYGSPYVQRKVFSMYGYVAAVNNTINFRFRYKKNGSWKTLVNAQALPGQVHHVYQRNFSLKRWRRWEVLNNGSNLVRYSVYGTD